MSRFSGVVRDEPRRLPRMDIDSLTAPGLEVPSQQQSETVRGLQQALAASLGLGSELGSFMAQQARIDASQRAQVEIERRREEAASEEARRTADNAERGVGVKTIRVLTPEALQQIQADQITPLPGESIQDATARVVGALIPADASTPFREAAIEAASPAVATALAGRQAARAEQGRDQQRTALFDGLSTLADPAEIGASLASARESGLITPEQERDGLARMIETRARLGDAAGVDAIASVLGERAPLAVLNARQIVQQEGERAAQRLISERMPALLLAPTPRAFENTLNELRAMPGFGATEEARAVDARNRLQAARGYELQRAMLAGEISVDAAVSAAQDGLANPDTDPRHIPVTIAGNILQHAQEVADERALDQWRAGVVTEAAGLAGTGRLIGIEDVTITLPSGETETVKAEEVRAQAIDRAFAQIELEEQQAGGENVPQRILARQFATLTAEAATHPAFTNTVLSGLQQARTAAATGQPVGPEAVAAMELWRQMPDDLRRRSFTAGDNAVLEIMDVAARYNFRGDSARAMQAVAGFGANSIDRGMVGGAGEQFERGLRDFQGTPQAYDLRRRAETVAAVLMQSGAIGNAQDAAKEATRMVAQYHRVVNGQAIDVGGIPAELIGRTETDGLAEVTRLLIAQAPVDDEDRRNLTLAQNGRGQWVLMDSVNLVPVQTLTSDQLVERLQTQRDIDARVAAESMARREGVRQSRLPSLNAALDRLDAEIAQVERTHPLDYPGLHDRRAILFRLNRERRQLMEQTQTLPPDPSPPTAPRPDRPVVAEPAMDPVRGPGGRIL
jgi:hypothetical protein